MNTILRSGYVQKRTRKIITVHRKDGTNYKYVRKAGTTRVKPAHIKDVGAAGKGPKLIGPLKHGMLTKFHYHPVEKERSRHAALKRAIVNGKEEPLAVMRRLLALSTLTKRTLPNASRVYRSDFEWLRNLKK